LWDHETSYGAGGTPDKALEGKITSFSSNKVNNLIRTSGLGDGRNETFQGFGNFDVNFSIEMEVASFDFFQFLIGSTDGGVGGSGTVVAPYFLAEADYRGYTGSGQELMSFVMEVASIGSTNNTDTFAGCVINSVGFNLEVGQTLKASIEGFARSPTSSTSASAFTANDTQLWIFAQGQFNWNGSNVARVQSAAINMTNNYDPEQGRALGSRFVQDMEPGLRKYDWTISVVMTDTVATTLRDHFYGQANSPHLGVITSEPTAYELALNLSQGATSGLRNAQFLISNNRINDISKPINIGDNLVVLSINGCGEKGTTDTLNKPIKYWTVP
jgi:Phage tail tube protein